MANEGAAATADEDEPSYDLDALLAEYAKDLENGPTIDNNSPSVAIDAEYDILLADFEPEYVAAGLIRSHIPALSSVEQIMLPIIAASQTVHKTCLECSLSLPHKAFGKLTRASDGLQPRCRACTNQRAAQFRNSSPTYKAAQYQLTKAWRLDNPETNRQLTANWKAAHPEKVKQYQKVAARWKYERYHTDAGYRILVNLRSRIRAALYGNIKSAKTKILIGCSVSYLINWLASQFSEEMTLENGGTAWVLDHFRPCARFDLTDAAQQRECFSWKNSRPMTPRLNNIKSDNAPSLEEITDHTCKVENWLLAHPNLMEVW